MQMYKLQKGDEIRVVAPSSSWSEGRAASYARGQRRLERLGYKVTFGKYVRDNDGLGSASAQKRASDLMSAYRDKNVKAIMALSGGWLANSILSELDWDVIRRNPKPLIGYSDITVIHNAIYAKTGNVGLHGPSLGTLGNRSGPAYMVGCLEKALRGEPYEVVPYDGVRRKKDKGCWRVLQNGSAEGVVVGGNIATLYLLQGTPYMPAFDRPTVLLIEDDDEAGKYTTKEFDRRLESLLQQPGARENIVGIMIGRFQPKSNVKPADVSGIIARKKLGGIPIVADIDCSHDLPLATFPIGGRVKLKADDTIRITIAES